MTNRSEIYEIALGGLLHDIGKFMQRASLEKKYPEIKNNFDKFCPTPFSYLHGAYTAYFIEKFIPDGLLDKSELYNAARHHKNSYGDIYKEADQISAGMDRYEDEVEAKGYKDICLHSIFDIIELQYLIKGEGEEYKSRWVYKIVSESTENYPFIPNKHEKCAGEDAYYCLWESFSNEVKAIKHIRSIKTYFNELFWLIQKYTSYIPSATNVFPDISLFDHLKTTSAIASCLFLYHEDPNKSNEEFILYSGDISGIQNYIFKISRVQGIGNIAKRLRGRSFYISLLSEVLAKYIIREVGLTQANINFCGGGNFEILLPNIQSVDEFLRKFERQINQWLLETFHGELGFVCAHLKLSKNELKTVYSKKRNELSELLQISKLKKFHSIIEKSVWQEDTDFHKEACHSCHLNAVPKGERFCKLCIQDKKIGELLPRTDYIIFSEKKFFNDSIEFGPFGYVMLLKKEQFYDIVNPDYDFDIYSVKSLPESPTDKIKAKFHISQTVPLALKEIELDTEEDEEGDKRVSKGQILSFSTLADMSTGDKRIGILKMDVDNLGFIFSLGIEENSKNESKHVSRSISRLANLSRLFYLFFSSYLDDICKDVFKKWQSDPNNTWPYRYDVSNIFYVIFSGGDDLVIVGPWDQVIELAWEIYQRFRRFTCYNPNITLSAGIYICKPKYPISYAVNKAEEALEQSKSKGKNRITVMGETMVWDEEPLESKIYYETCKKYYRTFIKDEIKSEKIFIKGETNPIFIDTLTFRELKEFAEELDGFLKSKKLSHRFLRNMLKAKKEFFPVYYNPQKDLFEEAPNLMVLPFLVYNIERNLNTEIKDIIKSKLITYGDAQKYVRQALFPCKYVLMKNRSY